MAKTETDPKDRRKYIKKLVKGSPSFGSELVLYGSIIILMWALGELNASYTFIVAWFKTDSRMIEMGYISTREYIFNVLLKTPEAVQAIKQLMVLCLGIIMGIVGIVLRKRKISVLTLITSVIIAAYEVADPFWMRLTDYTRYIKLAGCAMLFIGSVGKTVSWFTARRKAALKYEEKQRKLKQRNAARRDKTLIPERIQTGRK